MNEPVIPDEQLVKLYKKRLNGLVQVNELLQAKAAEQATTISDHLVTIHNQAGLISKQTTTIERLHSALGRYGNHNSECASWSRPNKPSGQPCDCGLNTALNKQNLN